jgi:hypothetical protein
MATPPATAAPRSDDPIRRDAGYRLLSEAIKALTIVNGGAAVAALAFLGQVAQRVPFTSVIIRDAAIALLVLCFGTILPPTAALAYAFYTYRPKYILYQYGRAALVASALLFLVGIFFGWKVLSPLGFHNLEVKH